MVRFLREKEWKKERENESSDLSSGMTSYDWDQLLDTLNFVDNWYMMIWSFSTCGHFYECIHTRQDLPMEGCGSQMYQQGIEHLGPFDSC